MVKGGTTSGALVTSMDIMPTVAEMLNIDLPENSAEDAVSFADVLNGKTDKSREYLINHSLKGVFAIRKGDWKLIMSKKSGGFSDFIYPKGYGIETQGQLYNLKDDPGETKNLWEQHPEIVKELKEKLKEIKNKK